MSSYLLPALLWLAICFGIASLGNNRKIGAVPAFVISLLLSPLIGLIVVLLSDKTTGNVKRWKVYRELAQRAEHKEDFQEAISNYKDAIFYLKNDFPKLNATDQKGRDLKIAEMENRITALKQQV